MAWVAFEYKYEQLRMHKSSDPIRNELELFTIHFDEAVNDGHKLI